MKGLFKVVNAQKLSSNRRVASSCPNIFSHSTRNYSNGIPINENGISDNFEEQNSVDFDLLKRISWFILNAKQSSIQFQHGDDDLQQLSIKEFKTDGELRKFPVLPLAKESRKNSRDMKLAILNILAVSSGVTAEILSNKITFDTIEEDTNETDHPALDQASLSVVFQLINDDVSCDPRKRFEIDNFDLIIDVRSPNEFKEDHIPNSINMPVLDDDERCRVGTIYSNDPRSARGAGAVIISRRISEMINDKFLTLSKDTRILVYCWRGGLRSKSLAVILNQCGFNNLKLLKGGYKNFRNLVTSSLNEMIQSHQYMVLAGNTGSGKSLILECLKEKGERVLHLEELANHKGSVLGVVGPQPSQKSFETGLWNDFRKLDPSEGKIIWIENEGNKVGKVHTPQPLRKMITSSSKIFVKPSVDQRVDHIMREYTNHINDPKSLMEILDGLAKFCGKKQVTEWKEMIEKEEFEKLVRSLINDYYDKTYQDTRNEMNFVNSKTFDWPSDLQLSREEILNCDVLGELKKLSSNFN